MGKLSDRIEIFHPSKNSKKDSNAKYGISSIEERIYSKRKIQSIEEINSFKNNNTIDYS